MPRVRLTDRVAAARAERAAASALRIRREIVARDGARVLVDDRQLVSFCGNDYLGLSQHLDVVAALQEAAAWHGVGSTGSPGVSGHHGEHAAFEREMAAWLGYERALYFGSGYAANLAVLQSLLAPGDVCVQDKLNHACLIDGARLAGAELKRYPHGDVEAALRQLMGRKDGVALLATDGVFSMDGDRAPLADLALVARTQDAVLMVDDAHGVGVLGPEGRGSLAVAGLGAKEVALLVVPLGKAFGGHGAVVLGSDALIGHVAETARPYLFSTAPAPAMAAAMRASLKLIRGEPWRRAKLASLVARFRRGASARGVPLLESFTPIQPVVAGANTRALAMAAALEKAGFLVTPIRPPTVPDGQARLRVTLTVDHVEADVDGLLAALADAVKASPDPVAA